MPPDVRHDARALAGLFWLGHRTEERVLLHAELEGHWRRLPPGRFELDEGRTNHLGNSDVEVASAFEILNGPIQNGWYRRFDPGHVPGGWGRDERSPVNDVTWYEARAFADWLSVGDGRVRLPSDAEWQYACRFGAQDVDEWCIDPGRRWTVERRHDPESIDFHLDDADVTRVVRSSRTGIAHAFGARKAVAIDFHPANTFGFRLVRLPGQ